MKQLVSLLMILAVGCASAGRKGEVISKKERYKFDNAFVIQATEAVWIMETDSIHVVDKDNMKSLKLEY